jgi:hypothetical protein
VTDFRLPLARHADIRQCGAALNGELDAWLRSAGLQCHPAGWTGVAKANSTLTFELETLSKERCASLPKFSACRQAEIPSPHAEPISRFGSTKLCGPSQGEPSERRESRRPPIRRSNLLVTITISTHPLSVKNNVGSDSHVRIHRRCDQRHGTSKHAQFPAPHWQQQHSNYHRQHTPTVDHRATHFYHRHDTNTSNQHAIRAIDFRTAIIAQSGHLERESDTSAGRIADMALWELGQTHRANMFRL